MGVLALLAGAINCPRNRVNSVCRISRNPTVTGDA
jgi:hypothetical protein